MGWGEAKKRTVTGRVYRLWDWYWFGRLGEDSCTAVAGLLAEAGEPHNLKIRKDVWRRVVCGGPAVAASGAVVAKIGFGGTL